MNPGKHVLIDVPRGRRARALFRVQADACRLGGHCACVHFQELNLAGQWVDEKVTGVRRERPKWVEFGEVQVKIAHGRAQGGAEYLNFYVKHLA
eukprot:6430845-Pyramimonas_sp.AAC.1